jgi:hypothetical protein
MKSAQKVYKHLADLYRLAFWLTGCQEVSVTIAIDAFDSLTDPFGLLQPSTRARLRKAIIGKALTARTAEDEVRGGLDSDESRLNDALFHLDLLSRKVFVLTVLEGYTIGDTSQLLQCDPGTVTEMRAVALSELSTVLAGRRGGAELHSNEASVPLV